jgi:predicted RNase H-related nuclease YkuK (DUF458 family)
MTEEIKKDMNIGWITLAGKHIENLTDELNKEILREIEDDVNDVEVLVGCDSQLKKGKVTYVIAIVLLRKRKVGGGGSGGRVYCFCENEKQPKGTYIQPKRRLWNETFKSVEVALWLDDNVLIEHALEVEAVHADLNGDKKFLSNGAVATCLGYIKGMGFNGTIKPDAWAASKVADRLTK